MTPNTKEKVLKEIKELKGKIKIEEKRYIYSGELVRMHSKLKILEAKLQAIDLTLAERNKEVGKVIKNYRKDMKVLEGDTELTFEEYMDNIEGKLGIK